MGCFHTSEIGTAHTGRDETYTGLRTREPICLDIAFMGCVRKNLLSPTSRVVGRARVQVRLSGAFALLRDSEPLLVRFFYREDHVELAP